MFSVQDLEVSAPKEGKPRESKGNQGTQADDSFPSDKNYSNYSFLKSSGTACSCQAFLGSCRQHILPVLDPWDNRDIFHPNPPAYHICRKFRRQTSEEQTTTNSSAMVAVGPGGFSLVAIGSTTNLITCYSSRFVLAPANDAQTDMRPLAQQICFALSAKSLPGLRGMLRQQGMNMKSQLCYVG